MGNSEVQNPHQSVMLCQWRWYISDANMASISHLESRINVMLVSHRMKVICLKCIMKILPSSSLKYKGNRAIYEIII